MTTNIQETLPHLAFNIVACKSPWTHRDLDILFEDEPIHFTECTELSTLMRELGIYKSGGEARRAGRTGPIPDGFTEFKASKKKTIWIWNPTE